MRQNFVRYLLRFDGTAALIAGVYMLLTCSFLASLYGVPLNVLLFNALVNLLYGSFSSTLATLQKRPLWLITALSIANCTWALVCFVYAFRLPNTATVFAVGHALFEGLFVGTLGVLEWRFRHQLAGRSVG